MTVIISGIWKLTVADPDLQIRGGGGGGGLKIFFRLFGPYFGLKIKGGPGPSPGSATD